MAILGVGRGECGDTRYIGDDYYPNDKHLITLVYCVSILNGYMPKFNFARMGNGDSYHIKIVIQSQTLPTQPFSPFF
jgi:hypothetical protein